MSGVTAGQAVFGLITVASIVLPFVLPAKKPGNSGGPRLGDQLITSSAYGDNINICYGTSRMAGNMIWTGGIVEVETTEKVGGGGLGKGGGSKQEITTYTYFASFAIAVCEGPVEAVLKVLLDGKIAQDRTGKKRYAKKNHDIHIKKGGEDQTPAQMIVDDRGSDAPAFRGIAYLLVDTLPLFEYGNRIPNVITIMGCLSDDNFPETTIDRGAGSESLPVGEYMVDSQRGFVYSLFDQTKIEKFDYITGTLSYSKAIEDTDGNAATINNLFGRAMALTTEGHIIAVETSGGSRFVHKIDPELGLIIETLDITGQSGSIGALAITTFPKMQGGLEGLGEGAAAAQEHVECWTMWMEHGTDGIRAGRLYPLMRLYENKAGMDFGALPYNSTGTAIDDAGAGVMWHLVYKSTATEAMGIVMNRGIVYETVSGEEGIENIQWLQKKYDIGGTDAAVPATPWINANPEADLNEVFVPEGGHDPLLAYVGDDNTLLIGLRTGDNATWRIGKFDIDTRFMIEIRTGASYEEATSTDEYFIDGDAEDDDVMANVVDTWESYRPLLNGGQGLSELEAWFAINLEVSVAEIKSFSPLTMALTRPGFFDANNFTGTYSTVTSKAVALAGRKSLFLDMNVGASPEDPSEIFLDRFTGAGTALDIVVSDMMRRAGLKEHQYDVSALTGDNVRGYSLGQRGAVKDNLSVLMLAFDFTFVETDWAIVFVKRGVASAFTIPERDLGAAENGGETEVLKLTNGAEREQAMALQVRFIDPARDEQENLAEYKRIIDPVSAVNVQSLDNVDLPLSMNPKEAQEVAKRSLARLWTERLEGETRLPPKYLGVDPTDVVTITADAETYVMRVMTASIGANRLLDFKGTIEDAGILSLDTTSIDGEPVDQDLDDFSESGIISMDTSLLRDLDSPSSNSYILYNGFKYPRSTGFPGATAYLGDDPDRMEQWFADSEAFEHGIAGSVLGFVGTEFVAGVPGTSQALDTVNTVLVIMTKGTPVSSSDDDDFLAGDPVTGGVKMLLGDEIIQAKTVVSNGNGTYTLSDLLRGRRGTDWAIASHHSLERAVVLKETMPFHISQHPASEVGSQASTVKYSRAVSTGSDYDSVLVQTHGITGASLRPYAPCDVQGFRDSNDVLRVRWIRRDRANAEWGWDDAQPSESPNSEATERYEMVLLVKGSFDPTDSSLWVESVVKTKEYTFMVDGGDLAAGLGFLDNGDGTAEIDDAISPVVDWTQFKLGSWVKCGEFNQNDMNSFGYVVATQAGDIDITIANAGSVAINVNATITQLPTHGKFSAAEIADAGYDTTEAVDVVVYQMSNAVGRGRPGFNNLGIGLPDPKVP